MTGSSGFLGRWAATELVHRGVELHAITYTSAEVIAGSIGHRCNLLEADSFDAIVGSVRPEIVLHLAWYVKHGAFWQAPENFDWVAATARVAKACKRYEVRRFVGVGTCFEYAWPLAGDCVEEQTPLQASTFYDASKDAVRRLIAAADVPSFAWARIFHLFGPFEDQRRLVASVARSLALRQTAETSSGSAVRDFMDVRDAGAALAAIAISNVQGAVNVSTGEGHSIRSIVERVARISEHPDLLRINAALDRPNEPGRIVGSARRLTDEVGFRRSFSLDRGLVDAYRWWHEHVRT